MVCERQDSIFKEQFGWTNHSTPAQAQNHETRSAANSAVHLPIGDAQPYPSMRFNAITAVLALIASLLLCGCGHWPPIVDTKRDIERLQESEPSIRARGLRDSDIPSLARLHELRILDFSGGNAIMAASITDTGLAYLAKIDLPHLDTLTLGYCGSITDAGLAHVGQMQTVTWLGLTACPQITDAGLPHLLTMRNLLGLDLRGCAGITDSGLQCLVAKTNWGTIMLGGCSNVTADGVARLQAALPNAEVKKDEKEWSYHK